jgi:hypothetical protein
LERRLGGSLSEEDRNPGRRPTRATRRPQ